MTHFKEDSKENCRITVDSASILAMVDNLWGPGLFMNGVINQTDVTDALG